MNSREVYAAVFVIVFLLLFCILLLRMPVAPEVRMIAEPVGLVLWKDRTFEVVLQGFIILAGVMSILLLVSRRGKEGSS